MKELPVINFVLIIGLGAFMGLHGDWMTEMHEATQKRIDKNQLALAAKIPEPIKFYTIPGYACDTTEWPGLCSNLGIDQAEYDKKNAHLFKVTSNQKGN